MEYKEFISDYLDKEKEKTLFPLENIPNIDLYVDQIISLLDDSFLESFQNDHEKPLTKTMINNYTKGKVLPPPQNKKYGKNHIILILLTIYLKPILSIKEIKTLFDALNNDLDNTENIDLQAFYNNTIDIVSLNKPIYLEDFEKFYISIENNNDIAPLNENLQLISFILILAIQANINISLSKTLIEKYLPIDPEKGKE